MTSYKRISKVEADIITLDQAKSWLRVSDSYDDTNIQMLIDATVTYAEKYMQLDLLTTTYEYYARTFYTDLTFRRAVAQSVESVEYLSNGVYTTMDTDNYTVVSTGVYSRITDIESVPSVDESSKAVKVTFKSGFGDTADSIPADIKFGLLSHVYYYYDNKCSGDAPTGVIDTYNNYRVITPFYE
jgi:uncharacterized phiE125 gp8 family phage protein